MDERHRAHGRRVALLTTGSLTKGIFSVALPIMVANAFTVVMELANAFFLGRIGSGALAAVTMAGGVVFFLMTFGSGLGIGTIALVARAYGARDFRRGEHIAAQSMLLGLVVSVVLGAAGFALAPVFLRLLGASGVVLAEATVYLRIAFAGLPFMIFMFQAGAAFQGSGDTLTPTRIGAATTVLNIALDPIMIFGLLGMPRLEVTGAAISSLTARVVGSALMARIILRGDHAVRLSRASMVLDGAVMWKIFSVGFPGAIQMLVRSTSFLAMTGLAALFGPAVVAAFGVGNRLFGIFLLPGFGFGAASSTLVGQNLGARDPDRAQRAAVVTSGYYLVFVTAAAIPLCIFARHVARAFNGEPAFVDLTALVIRFVSVAALFMPFGMTFGQALQGAGATVTSMALVAASLLGVQIPLAWFLSTRTALGAHGIWWAHVGGGVAQAALMSWFFFRGAWKKTRL